ncbi:MAG: ABC transporter permease [Acidimicrobiales bacterium]|jgi:ABC-type polysaccharide/polyol phosphate export permease|nr:ABC transporter permease [Acidimicrobiales bacterium]
MAEPSSSPTVHVYEPTDTGLPPLHRYLREIWGRRAFMWHLSRSELKAQHYDTVIGQAWIVLDPLLEAAVYYLLRTVVRPIGTDAERNALLAHLIMAVFFFGYTRASLMGGTKAILSNRNTVLNSSLPRLVFPLVAVIEAFLDFLPTFVVYMGLHVLLGQPITAALLWLPLILVLLTMFNLGLALLASTVTVFFRDASDILPYATRIWLYVSPVLFTVSEVPPNIAPYLKLNPMYWFLGSLELIFTGHGPTAKGLFMMTVFAVAVFGLGAFYFLRRERDLAVRL